MYKLLLVSILASSAVWVATSVHRQPFVPLHLCNDSHLCRCIVQRLCVAVFMHPCITALCDRYRASLHDPQVAGSRTRRTKNNTPLIELAKVWRGCRIAVVWVAASCSDSVRPLSCILARPAQCEFAPQHQKKQGYACLGIALLFWCRWRGSNPHGIATNGF